MKVGGYFRLSCFYTSCFLKCLPLVVLNFFFQRFPILHRRHAEHPAESCIVCATTVETRQWGYGVNAVSI